VVSFNGGLNDQTSKGDSGEANLDQQYITGIGYPLPVTEFSTAGRGLLITDGDSPTQADNTNEPYLDFLLALLKLPNSQIPNSISISYGENEQEIPVSYAKQVCNLFAELGARGKTILFASGDSGTGSSCISNDGKNITRFNPIFPASCPNVTSVGGTRYIQPEVATFFSSGGQSISTTSTHPLILKQDSPIFGTDHPTKIMLSAATSPKLVPKTPAISTAMVEGFLMLQHNPKTTACLTKASKKAIEEPLAQLLRSMASSRYSTQPGSPLADQRLVS